MTNPITEIRKRYGFDVTHAACILMTASFIGGADARALCTLVDGYVAEKGLDRKTVLVAFDYLCEANHASVLEDELEGRMRS